MITGWNRWRGLILACCVGLLLGDMLLIASRNLPGFPLGGPGDYTAFHSAARIAVSGDAERLYDLGYQQRIQERLLSEQHLEPKEEFWPFYYPPIALIPFLALARLSLAYGFFAWNVFNTAILALSLYLILKDWGEQTLANICFAMILTLSFFPIFTAFQNGQMSILCLFILSVAKRAMNHDQHFAAGGILGLLCIKPQLTLGFLIWLLLCHKWRSLAGFVTVCLSGIALSSLLVGKAGIVALYKLMLSSLKDDSALPNLNANGMPNIVGSVSRLFRFASDLSSDFPVSYFSTVLATLIGIYVIHLLRTILKTSVDDNDFQLGVATVVSLLLSPHIHGHDLSLLCLSELLVARYLLRAGKPDRARNLLLACHVGVTVVWIALPVPWAAQLVAIGLFYSLWWIRRFSCRLASENTAYSTIQSNKY